MTVKARGLSTGKVAGNWWKEPDMGAMAWPLPPGRAQEGAGCAARRMWRGACGALGLPDPDDTWQRLVRDSPPDSLWHSLRNCVAHQAGVWQNLLNRGIDDVLQPAAFKLALVMRHTPSDVAVTLLAELLDQHPQGLDLTSYILALLTDDEPIWSGPGSSSISPSPTASGVSPTSGEEGESADGGEEGESADGGEGEDSADGGEGDDSADGGESGEGRESADSGESEDSENSEDSSDSEDSADSGGSINSVEGAEVQVDVVIRPPADDRRRDDLCDSTMVPDSTTGADSTTGPDYGEFVRRNVAIDSREIAVGEVTEGVAASEAAAAAEAAEAEAVVDSTEANDDLELVFDGEALGEAIAAIASGDDGDDGDDGDAASTPAGPAPLRDLQLFGDCELAVLAASREEYDAHAKLVRAEYSKLTNDNYIELRVKVLKQFDNIPRLFSTSEFECFESAARENINREIATLQEHLLTGRRN